MKQINVGDIIGIQAIKYNPQGNEVFYVCCKIINQEAADLANNDKKINFGGALLDLDATFYRVTMDGIDTNAIFFNLSQDQVSSVESIFENA